MGSTPCDVFCAIRLAMIGFCGCASRTASNYLHVRLRLARRSMEPTRVRLTIPDTVDPTALMGPADTHLRRIEGAFDEAMVVVRGNQVLIVGPAEQVEQVGQLLAEE